MPLSLEEALSVEGLLSLELQEADLLDVAATSDALSVILILQDSFLSPPIPQS